MGLEFFELDNHHGEGCSINRIKENCKLCSIHLFVESLTKALESRDPYTAGHSDRVARLTERVAEEMDFEKDRSNLIHLLGHVHDIGKIGIPDGILLKTGPLSKAEYSVIQEHSAIGYNILKDIPYFGEHAKIVLYHHERMDGSGYPEGLTENDIPIESSILAVADVFDALTSARSYRKALKIDAALELINKESGSKLNKIVVDKLFSVDKLFLKDLVETPDHYQMVYLNQMVYLK
jgi:HD-GYP domain-containing protein (c-di-GMP phosphodiesterase class II)